ncbi:ATP-binding protein [Planotetraspora phitsanulokensis]|nr:ATP-binding protein [Planotetraspora phitsanulokensis]
MAAATALPTEVRPGAELVVEEPVRRSRPRRPVQATRPAQGHRMTWVLADDPSAVPEGRRLVRGSMAGWRLDGQTDVVELLAAELITNALRHAWGKPLLTLSLIDGTLRCEVNDLSPEMPHIRPAGTSEEDEGRGLRLLERMSDRWGSVLTYTGKVVWFEVAASSPAMPYVETP